ncbi:MAG: hypothetical protein DWI25_06450 [Planctomycetota bacterium]|nr:MAG: hypothetical protein DWI25_06450 [Planctomycetota bacterium]
MPEKNISETISFQCTNGHKLKAPAQAAGKTFKCPSCKDDTLILVPSQSTPPLTTAKRPGQTIHNQPVQKKETISAEKIGPPVGIDSLETVPSELPEINVDVNISTKTTTTNRSKNKVPISGSSGAVPPVEELELQELFKAVDSEAEESDSGTAPRADRQSEEIVLPSDEHFQEDEFAEKHPTSRLVARLWGETEHGGKLEFHITGGSVIRPQYYEPGLSAGTHGLFANVEVDNTITLTALAWDSIQKIIVRKVETIPPGFIGDH